MKFSQKKEITSLSGLAHKSVFNFAQYEFYINNTFNPIYLGRFCYLSKTREWNKSRYMYV